MGLYRIIYMLFFYEDGSRPNLNCHILGWPEAYHVLTCSHIHTSSKKMGLNIDRELRWNEQTNYMEPIWICQPIWKRWLPEMGTPFFHPTCITSIILHGETRETSGLWYSNFQKHPWDLKLFEMIWVHTLLAVYIATWLILLRNCGHQLTHIFWLFEYQAISFSFGNDDGSSHES